MDWLRVKRTSCRRGRLAPCIRCNFTSCRLSLFSNTAAVDFTDGSHLKLKLHEKHSSNNKLMGQLRSKLWKTGLNNLKPFSIIYNAIKFSFCASWLLELNTVWKRHKPQNSIKWGMEHGRQICVSKYTSWCVSYYETIIILLCFISLPIHRSFHSTGLCLFKCVSLCQIQETC